MRCRRERAWREETESFFGVGVGSAGVLKAGGAALRSASTRWSVGVLRLQANTEIDYCHVCAALGGKSGDR